MSGDKRVSVYTTAIVDNGETYYPSFMLHGVEQQLAAVTAERDRLREACEKMLAAKYDSEIYFARQDMRDLLASLKPLTPEAR